MTMGSPPHVRGKDLQRLQAHAGRGITPACAGKSRISGRFFFCMRDHPRMCGEKLDAQRSTRKTIGSPPHVRGKVLRAGTGRRRDGITPACAGKRALCLAGRTAPRDHPRMCGEKRGTSMNAATKTGSPPHVRGKVLATAVVCVLRGITPACAGKSNAITALTGAQKDHPRMCGEKSGTVGEGEEIPGSPPHVRGKVFSGLFVLVVVGITPACAGKRLDKGGFRSPNRDHPRMCGEKSMLNVVAIMGRGSPPHVRGKAIQKVSGSITPGITPACAGKRVDLQRTIDKNRDHPRMCGEKTKKIP